MNDISSGSKFFNNDICSNLLSNDSLEYINDFTKDIGRNVLKLDIKSYLKNKKANSDFQ